MRTYNVEFADGTTVSVVTNFSTDGLCLKLIGRPVETVEMTCYQHLADGFRRGKIIDKGSLPYRDDGGYSK